MVPAIKPANHIGSGTIAELSVISTQTVNTLPKPHSEPPQYDRRPHPALEDSRISDDVLQVYQPLTQ